MLAANIEDEVKRILKKKGCGGWLRVEECAKEFGTDPITRGVDNSVKTRFYRWRKKVEDGKVRDFQLVKLPGNISFIGLKSADPRVLQSLTAGDGEPLRVESTVVKYIQPVKSGLGFFDWLNCRRVHAEEQKEREKLECRARIDARMETMMSSDEFTHAKFVENLHKHRKKYGLERRSYMHDVSKHTSRA